MLKVRLLLVGILCLLGAACEDSEVEPMIGDLVAKRSAYLGEMVEVEGEVVDVVEADGGAAYRVEDVTGVIMVVTSDAPPAVGDRVEVDGVVEQNIVVGGTPVDVAIREASRE